MASLTQKGEQLIIVMLMFLRYFFEFCFQCEVVCFCRIKIAFADQIFFAFQLIFNAGKFFCRKIRHNWFLSKFILSEYSDKYSLNHFMAGMQKNNGKRTGNSLTNDQKSVIL